MLGHTLGVLVCVQVGSGASVGVSSRRRVSRRGRGFMSGEKEVESKAEEELEEGLRGLLLIEQREKSEGSPRWKLRRSTLPKIDK